jgi:hypothetical protein
VHKDYIIYKDGQLFAQNADEEEKIICHVKGSNKTFKIVWSKWFINLHRVKSDKTHVITENVYMPHDLQPGSCYPLASMLNSLSMCVGIAI